MFEYLCIIGVFIFIFVLAFLVYISCKKYFLEVFPNQNIDSFKQRLIQLFYEKGWNVEVKKGRVHVESGSFTAVDLHFKQNGPNVEIYYVSSATILTWALMIIGIFVLTIMTIIVALVADSNSRNFANDIIRPLLLKIKERGLAGVSYDFPVAPGTLIPGDAEITRKNTRFNSLIIVGAVVVIIGAIIASFRVTEYSFWGLGSRTSFPYLYPGMIIAIAGLVVMLISLILKVRKKKTY